jgi:LPS-assembly lipoprotein
MPSIINRFNTNRFSGTASVISRRLFLGAALAGALPLSGCGFHLRGSFETPFKTMYLQMSDNSPFAVQLARQLKGGSNLEIVSDPTQAEAIFVLISERRSRDVLSINDAGRSREYELTMRVRYRVSSPEGFDWLETREISTTRQLTYSETRYLSREYEEAFLYNDMRQDLINQIVHSIEAIPPHK